MRDRERAGWVWGAEARKPCSLGTPRLESRPRGTVTGSSRGGAGLQMETVTSESWNAAWEIPELIHHPQAPWERGPGSWDPQEERVHTLPNPHTRTHTREHKHRHTCAYQCTHMYAHTHMHMQTQHTTHTHAHAYRCTCAQNTHTEMHTCATHTCTDVHVYHIRARTGVHVQHTRTRTQMHTHRDAHTYTQPCQASDSPALTSAPGSLKACGQPWAEGRGRWEEQRLGRAGWGLRNRTLGRERYSQPGLVVWT